jgi:multiple antibiotic resistance protein
VAEFAFNVFVTLLVVIDPSGMAPIFAALTRSYPTKRKRETTIRGVLLGAAILLVFASVGNTLLDALGIRLPAFWIASGVLLFLVALDQIFVSPSGLHSRTVREQEEESYQRDVFVFPLAVPLLADPARSRASSYTPAAVVLQSWRYLTLASLLFASQVMRLLGETGAHVLTRVLGVLLAATSRAVRPRRHPGELSASVAPRLLVGLRLLRVETFYQSPRSASLLYRRGALLATDYIPSASTQKLC